MEQDTVIFVYASPEIERLLSNNGTDVTDLLIREGIGVKRSVRKDPMSKDDLNYRDPTSVILAAATLVLALTPIIKTLIETLSHKEVVVRNKIAVPIEDSHGNIVRRQDGEPMMNWIELADIVESTGKSAEEIALSVKGPFAFEINYKSLVQNQPKH